MKFSAIKGQHKSIDIAEIDAETKQWVSGLCDTQKERTEIS